jgi:hypothetical protein
MNVLRVLGTVVLAYAVGLLGSILNMVLGLVLPEWAAILAGLCIAGLALDIILVFLNLPVVAQIALHILGPKPGSGLIVGLILGLVVLIANAVGTEWVTVDSLGLLPALVGLATGLVYNRD